MLSDDDDLPREVRVAVAVAVSPREDFDDPSLPDSPREDDLAEPLLADVPRVEREELPLSEPRRDDLDEVSFSDELREDFADSLPSVLEDDD